MSSYHWSVHQMAEYFTAISGHVDESTTLQVAVERTAEALDAELVLVVRDRVLLGQVGLGRGAAAPDELLDHDGVGGLQVPGLGQCHVVVSERRRREGVECLVAVRAGESFSGEERQLLQGMGQFLTLAVRGLRTLAAERALREEREREAEARLRMLGVVQARERLLQRLLTIQRAISRRQPLPAVLDAVAVGAAGLLDLAPVGVALKGDTSAALRLVAVSGVVTRQQEAELLSAAVDAVALGAPVCQRTPDGLLLAVPAHVGSIGESALAALVPSDADVPTTQDLLGAFAQQVSTALIDARTLEQVQQARHDHLTGLPSRALFLERLSQALGARDEHPRLALLFIDLDRFKQVNDSLGHAAGDELLTAVARRLRACLRSSDTPARLGGDEFAVLLDGTDSRTALAVAERITQAMREPFAVVGREVFIACSIGVVEPADGRQDAVALLNSADVAMYRSKKAGGGTPVWFTPAMHADALERLDLQGDLQRALGAGQLALAYQPLVRLSDGTPVGVEALLRWTHPERGPVPPSVFVPLAEETGLIVELGRWVLQEAARQVVRWRALLPGLRVSVNVSARQLQEQDFTDHVLSALDASGLPPAAMTLELTETVLVVDPASAPARLGRLRDLGVRLSIDDFGTGYSSLSYLRRLPVDELKIDRAFIAGITSAEEDVAVVRTILDLARTLGLDVVAEGIEDAGQLEALHGLGCPLGQGYHLARPLPAAEVAPFLLRPLRSPAARARSA